MIDRLQVDRTSNETGEQQCQRAEDDGRAQPRQLERRVTGRTRRRAAQCRRACFHRAPSFGPGSATISVREELGSCIRSCSRAIFSTRAGMPHVDCSSLQLAVFGFVSSRFRLRPLELDEDLPRLVARGHERQRAADQHGEQQQVDASHAARSSR